MLQTAYLLADRSDRRCCVLDNGLTAIALRHDAAPLVSARIYVRAGSVFEGRYVGSGISHLLEHLITCDGAGARSESELLRVMDEMGGLFNAYTSVDHLCYHGSAPIEEMNRAMGLLADYTVRPHMSNSVFERELGVVQRELERDRDDPDVQLEEIAGELAYRGHPLSQPIIGHRALLTQLSHADLTDWYRQTHGGENTFVVIAGPIEPEEAIACIASTMQDLPRGKMLDTGLFDPVRFTGDRRATKIMQVDSSSCSLQWQTVREGDSHDAALDVLSTILTDGDDARLTRELRWNTGLVYDIGGSHESYWHTPGVLTVSMQYDAANADRLKTVLRDQIDQLLTNPVTDEELSRAVSKLRLSVLSARQTIEGSASQIAEDLLALGDLDYSNHYLKRLSDLKPNDITAVADQYLVGRPMAEARIEPAGDGAVRHRGESKVGCWQQDAVVEQASTGDGSSVYLRPIIAQPFVAVHATFEGGVLHEAAGQSGWFNLLAQLWTRGAGGYSADNIASLFADHGTTLQATAGMNQFGLGFTCLAESLPALLPVWSKVLMRPSLEEAELEKIRPTILDKIARQDEQWGTELMRFARRCLFEGSPWRRTRLGTAESVRSATASSLANMFQQYAGAQTAHIAITGAIDPTTVINEFNKLLTSWNTSEITPSRPSVTTPVRTSDALFVKPSSADREVAGVFIGFHGITLHDFDRRAAVCLLETILAGYALSGGRLYERLRGSDDDLAYEVSSVGFAGLIPGFVGFAAGCRPDCVNAVYRIMREEIDAIQRGKFDDAELNRARMMIRMGDMDQMQTATDHAARIAIDGALGLGANDGTRFLNEIATVSLKDVQAIASEILHGATICVTTPTPDAVKLGIPLQDASLIL